MLRITASALGACATLLLVPIRSSGSTVEETASASEEAADKLQEVVVTARKREENLQQVPLSVKAYTADELQAQSIQRLSDLGQVTPNLLYGQKIQSGSSAGQIYLRGIGQQDTNVTFSPSVGIYVDGVYLGRAQGNDLDMADVERAEVLYGPQGTLFGKNTNGGAINVVTRKPDLSAKSPRGSVEVEAGNYSRLDDVGRVNLPLAADTAAVQLSATRRRQDGYSVRIDGQQQADQDRTSGRAQFLVRPGDTFEALLSVDGTTFNEHSGAYKLVEVRTSSTIPVLYATLTPYRYDNRWVTSSDFIYDGTGPNKNVGSVWGTSLTLTWDQPWGTLKSISAFRQLDVESDFDPDGSPLTVLDVFNRVTQHQTTEELQATGSSFRGRLDWVAGLYYFTEIAQDNQPVNIAYEVFQGAANFDPRSQVVNRNYAAYGQTNFALTSRLKLTLGGRAGDDRAKVGLIHVGYPNPVVQQPLVTHSASWTSFLPRAGLEYQWTPDVMTYLSAAEGSKSGGFNGRAASIAEFNEFQPEKVWAYEAGLRSDWLKKRVRLNATAFYSDYKEFQILLNRSTTNPITGKPEAFSFVGNMPKAAIKGGEFALTAVPVANLRVSAGLGFTFGEYKEIIAGAPVTLHSQFVNTPKCTVTAGAEYSVAMREVGLLTGRFDYIHKTTIQYDYGNSPLVAQGPYGLLNARLTWQTWDARLSLFLFGTNLTNSHYAVGGIDDGPTGSLGEVTRLMGAPLEWGLGGQYRF